MTVRMTFDQPIHHEIATPTCGHAFDHVASHAFRQHSIWRKHGDIFEACEIRVVKREQMGYVVPLHRCNEPCVAAHLALYVVLNYKVTPASVNRSFVEKDMKKRRRHVS